jgi:hypothetical protein
LPYGAGGKCWPAACGRGGDDWSGRRMTALKNHTERLRRRSVADFPSKFLGFIFCEIFSNLVATGCRRGRTPERPLRQPSKVRLIRPGLSSCEDRPPRTGAMCRKWVNPPCRHSAPVAARAERRESGFTSISDRAEGTVLDRGASLGDGDEAVQELSAQRSQIGIAGVALRR